jgi:RHS repeat-associated protein
MATRACMSHGLTQVRRWHGRNGAGPYLLRKTTIDFRGLSIVQDFDKMDRLASKSLPQVTSGVDVARTVTYTYAGPLLTQVSEVGTGLSRTDYLKYDEARRLRKKDSPEGVLTYEYNARGQVSRTKGFRRGLVSVDAEVGTATADVDVEYGYDPLGRLATTKNNKVSGSNVSTNYYDVVGNLSLASYPNKVRHFWEYTEQNRLKSTRVEKFENGTVTLHRRYDYALGVGGHRKQVIEKLANDVTRRSVAYQYDYAESPPLVGVLGTGASLQELRPPLAKVYRLTEEKLISDSAGPKTTYKHDLLGNRLGRTDTGLGSGSDQSYVYAANDRVTSDTTPEFTYDANGNTVTSGTGTVTDYYDAENRLVKRAAPGNLAITMGYDTSGNRVWKHVNNNGTHKTTYYLVDDQNPTGYAQVLLEMEDSAASPTPTTANFHERYEYGLRLISVADASNTYYLGCDGQNSVRMLLDAGGNVLANSELDYDAYGNQLSANNLTFDLHYRYDGEQWDSDLGMYYLRARYYSQKLGRFWSADPFEGVQDDPLTLHKYLYCRASPVLRVDPLGLSDGTIGGQAANGGIMGLVSSLTIRVVAHTMSFVARNPGLVRAMLIGQGAITMYSIHEDPSQAFLYIESGGFAADAQLFSEAMQDIRGAAAIYKDLDSLRRSGGVFARLSKDLLKGTAASVEVAGANAAEGLQRGHLLPKQLGGAGSVPENLTPIYQSLNNGRMKSIENEVRRAVDSGETVEYRVTPIFEGDNVVPKYIKMEARGDRGLRITETLENRKEVSK